MGCLMPKHGVARISISLPPSLLEEFDRVISSIGFDRSKAIQQAMRDYISEYQWEHDPAVSAVAFIHLPSQLF